MEDCQDENAVHRDKIITPQTEAEVIKMHHDGFTYNDIVRIKGIGYAAIKRCCERGRPRTDAEYREVVALYRPCPSRVEILSQCREFRIQKREWSIIDEKKYNRELSIQKGEWTSIDETNYLRSVSDLVLK